MALDVPDVTSVALPIEAEDLAALFVRGAEPTFPHSRRMVDPRAAVYLENLVRDRRRAATVALEIRLRERPPAPSEEDEARRDLQAYFGTERKVVELELRVNQREGWGFLRRTFPLLIAALALAGVFYVAIPGFPTGPVGQLLTALFYLLFITVVWVLLWDPIEKLLFDAFLLRARIAALQKLEGASVQFNSSPAVPAARGGSASPP